MCSNSDDSVRAGVNALVYLIGSVMFSTALGFLTSLTWGFLTLGALLITISLLSK